MGLGWGLKEPYFCFLWHLSEKCTCTLIRFKTRKIKLEFDLGLLSPSLEEEDGVGVAGPLGERLPRRLEGRLRAHVRHRLQAPSVIAQVLQVSRRIYY